ALARDFFGVVFAFVSRLRAPCTSDLERSSFPFPRRRPMAGAEVHPSVEELAAFTLGTLDDETDASIGAHVAACTSCQQQAANAPGDTFVELLRSVHARPDFGTDTVAELAAHVQTPPPLAADPTAMLAPAVAPPVPAESDGIEVPDAL